MSPSVPPTSLPLAAADVPASGAESESIEVSIVVPVFNEEESLHALHAALGEVLEGLGRTWEVVYCDDGSTDGSWRVLEELCAAEPRARGLRFRRNFGQTAAMAAGFDAASGEVIIPIDADLQNDPADIPSLLAKIDEGFDVVSGWRAERKDALLSVTLPSRIGNWVIGRVTGVRLHDYGCTLTAYRRDVLDEVKLYGEMHRFIPAWAATVGARITEVPVRHHARRFGRSKYGLSKALRVILDLMTVYFLMRYATKPLYFFGRLGLRILLVAGAAWTWTLVKRIIWGEPLFTDPYFLIGIFLATVGVQVILIGLLAELSMRTRYESQGKKIYLVRERLNL